MAKITTTTTSNNVLITESQIESSNTSSATVSTSTTTKNLRYGVINPETGAYVDTSDPNYEKYKAELGGDAGTVPDNKSTACQAALQKIMAANEEKQKEADANSKANTGGQLISDQPIQSSSN